MGNEEFNKEDYEKRIAELEQQLEDAQKGDESLEEIKNKYQEIIDEKDNEIKELNKTVEETNKKAGDAVNDLTNEVEERLKQTEAYKDMEEKLHEMEVQRAEATVDSYIAKGVLLPIQRDSAVELCLTNNETFLNLYRDAKPIVETQNTRKSVPSGTAERVIKYLKRK